MAAKEVLVVGDFQVKQLRFYVEKSMICAFDHNLAVDDVFSCLPGNWKEFSKIILHVGSVNICERGQDAEIVLLHYKNLIRKIKAENCLVEIIVSAVLPIFPDKNGGSTKSQNFKIHSLNANVTELNASLKDMCEHEENLVFFTVWQDFHVRSYFTSNGRNLSSKGSQYFAQNLTLLFGCCFSESVDELPMFDAQMNCSLCWPPLSLELSSSCSSFTNDCTCAIVEFSPISVASAKAARTCSVLECEYKEQNVASKERDDQNDFVANIMVSNRFSVLFNSTCSEVDFPADSYCTKLVGGGPGESSSYPRTCKDCGRVYQNKSSYYNHSKTCGLTKSIYPRTCPTCQKIFKNKVAFCKHKPSCNEAKPVNAQEKITYPRLCEKCNVSFDSKCLYFNHFRKQCNNEEDSKSNFKGPCLVPDCQKTFYHRSRMVAHLNKDHGVDTKISQHKFLSLEEFILWKENLQKETFSYYTAPCGPKLAGDHIYHYYSCQNDLLETSHCKTGVDNRKSKWTWSKGRVQTKQFCTSRFLVTENCLEVDGKIEVTFIEGHNHELDFSGTKFHRVSGSTRQFIKTCLMMGMKTQNILDLLRGDAGNLDKRDGQIKPSKDIFITAGYIQSLRHELKLEGRLHKSDHVAVDMHVRNIIQTGRFKIDGVTNDDYDGFEDGMFSPVLVYKPQGGETVIGDKELDTDKDLFAVGFQTKEQFDVMKEGCKTVLCVDSTYSTTGYGFYLVNLVVPDETKRGYPVAHFIVSSQDTHTLVNCLKSIKKRYPNLEINMLMTDDDQCEWKAFKQLWPNIKCRLCLWHVRRNWAKKLVLIPNLKLRLEVYHCLTVMTYERNEDIFQSLLEGFMSGYAEKCFEFVNYFQNYYAHRPEAWAMAYRNFPHGFTDTNMYCESFHNKLKTYYMERKQNVRVEDLMSVLFKPEKDYFLRLWQWRAEKRQKVKVTKSQAARHKRGMTIKDDDVVCSGDDKSRTWMVKSQQEEACEDDVHYYVTKFNRCELDHCFDKCVEKDCEGLCIHLYTCTCKDFYGLCKHIHKVHSLYLRNGGKVNEGQEISSGDLENNLSPSFNHLVHPDDEQQDVNNLHDVDSTRSTLLLAECEELCQSLQVKMAHPANAKMLPFFRNQLKQLLGHCNTTTQGHAEKLDKFVPTMTVSGSQKIVRQQDLLKFKRTAKKPSKKSGSTTLQNPTFEQHEKTKLSLLSLKDRAILKRKNNDGPVSSLIDEQCTEATEAQAQEPGTSPKNLNSQPETSAIVGRFSSPSKNNVIVEDSKIISSRKVLILSGQVPHVVPSDAPSISCNNVRSSGKDNFVSVSEKLASGRISSSGQSSSKSFTPKLGFTDNIHQTVIFFNAFCNNSSSITFRSLKTLDPYLSKAECQQLNAKDRVFSRGWLHEEVIDCYIHKLCMSRESNIRALPSGFINAFKRNGTKSGFVLACLQLFGTHDLELILMPANITNLHWTLFVWNVKSYTVHFYDPMAVTCGLSYLQVFSDLCKAIGQLFEKFLNVKWNLTCPPHSCQTDSISCGVFVCLYANCIVQEKPLTTTVDTPQFRKEIYDTIVGNCLQNLRYYTKQCVICLQKKSASCIQCVNCHQFYHEFCILKKAPTVSISSEFKCLKD